MVDRQLNLVRVSDFQEFNLTDVFISGLVEVPWVVSQPDVGCKNQ